VRDLSYNPANFRREYVQTAERLERVVEELRRSDAIGVDLEMGQRVERLPGGRQEWKHILALIQVASDTVSVLIDPLRCADLSPLAPIMKGPIRKVFLGGGQDIALLQRSGIPAHAIVDVGEIALGIFGRREDGMAALSHRMFGISLDKTVRRADWMVRPLNPTLAAYAYRDAELTLLIYRWFQANYPDIVRSHERDELDPPLPRGTPEWLEIAVTRPSTDALAIVMGFGMDANKEAERLSGDVIAVLRGVTAPRLANRLVRIASDLGLRGVLPDILPLAGSHSSVVRSSAARALGHLGTAEEVEAPLLSLAHDPVEEVRKVAEAALKELATPPPPAVLEEETDETGSLDENTLAALRRLLETTDSEKT